MLFAVFFYVRYSPALAAAAKKSKRPVATSWKMDEMYIKVKGEGVYLVSGRG